MYGTRKNKYTYNNDINIRNNKYDNKYNIAPNYVQAISTKAHDIPATTEKNLGQTWGYQVLPSLYSIYQKVKI